MAELGLVEFWIKRAKWPDFRSEPGMRYDCRALARELARDVAGVPKGDPTRLPPDRQAFGSAPGVERNGGRCRVRTYDPLIKSQLLYQLS